MPANRTSEPHPGRVALVTGAARGIGQAIAAGLAERGTRTVLGDSGDVSETSDLVGAPGHPAVPVTPDVSDPPSTEAARDRATDALGAPTSSRSRGNTTLRTCSTTTPTSSPRRPAGGRTTRVTSPRLGNHPITPALLATDLAAAREFYHGKLGLQIDRKNENAIGFRYGNGTRLDVTQSTVGTADQQIQAAGRSATSAPRWPNSAPAASRSKTATPQAKDRRQHRRHRLRLGRLDHRPSHERPQAQLDTCHLTWPELRPGGLRGRRLRCCGSLLGGVLDLVKGICRDPLRASGFCSCGQVRAAW
jgi:catechol 2,3-dioxygenase-like lactoylglutathione lyase family enzyme